MPVIIDGTNGVTTNSGTLISATTIGVGGATPSTSGAGITFPATQSASSDANTLDDYEEGSWTPTISGISTTGTGTYSVQVGRYTKVGNLVTISARVTWSAHTGTGNMSITGLPFVNQNVNDLYGSVTFGYVNNLALTANNLVTGVSIFNTSRIDLYQYPVGGGGGLAVSMDTAADIIFTVTYMTA